MEGRWKAREFIREAYSANSSLSSHMIRLVIIGGEDAVLLRCPIIRFTLQPIVENAIFHGIEPKGSAGTIRIHIYHTQESRMQSLPRNATRSTAPFPYSSS